MNENTQIAHVEGTPIEAYNPAKMFNFHAVRFLAGIGECTSVHNVVCRDFVTHNSTVTMYSIHKPFTFNAYRLGVMKDVLFNGEVLTCGRMEMYINNNNDRRISYRRETMDVEIKGYKLLECKTINVNRLDDVESHTTEPNSDSENVWYKVTEEIAIRRFEPMRTNFELQIEKQNKSFVDESGVARLFSYYLDIEQANVNYLANDKNERETVRAEKQYDKDMKQYNALNAIVRFFTPKPVEVVPVKVEAERLTELPKARNLAISSYINGFNTRHGELLDLQHVFNKFGQPRK